MWQVLGQTSVQGAVGETEPGPSELPLLGSAGSPTPTGHPGKAATWKRSWHQLQEKGP